LAQVGEFSNPLQRLSQMSLAGLTVLFCALLSPVVAQIQILGPYELARHFKKSNGVIYGSTATFGAPYYGQRVVGRLVYSESVRGNSHCTEDDYAHTTPAGTIESKGAGLANVVVVSRGQCSIGRKVHIAEQKRAAAVIVIDYKTSTKKPSEIQREVVSSGHWENNVKIPSVLISRLEGNLLLDAMQHEAVVVELAWDIPRREVVQVDLWMSSGSRESSQFLESFKDSAETLQQLLQFVPHYNVFTLPPVSSDVSLCSGGNTTYCAPDPDGPGPVTGADVVDEDARQICLLEATAKPAPGALEGAPTYSKEWWDYVARVHHDCPLKEKVPERRFGKTCSYKLMERLGIDTSLVHNCILVSGREYLQRELHDIAWSPQALRVNGWRYGGTRDRESVLSTICSAYDKRPHECDIVQNGFFGRLSLTAHKHAQTLSTYVGIEWMFIVVVLLGIANFIMYGGCRMQAFRTSIRETVMQEVHVQISDYAKLEDGR